MSIENLKRFFAFEADEPEHIDDIVALLETGAPPSRSSAGRWTRPMHTKCCASCIITGSGRSRLPLPDRRCCRSATQPLRGFTEKQ